MVFHIKHVSVEIMNSKCKQSNIKSVISEIKVLNFITFWVNLH